jgi:acylphosphatase
MPRLHIVVNGRVQGIGFRWFVQRTARELGVSGWVKNLYDGSVELEADGTQRLLDVFIERLKHGHPHADVQSIDVEERQDGQNPYEDFEIHF